MMNLKNLRFLEIILILISMFFIMQSINASDLLIRANSNDILNGGHFNFDNIAPANRKQAVTFNIINTSNRDINLTGSPKVSLKSIDATTDEFIKDDISLSSTLLKGQTYSFTITYTSTIADGKLIKAQVTINNDSSDGPYVFTISCTAMSTGYIRFLDVGTHYWRSPCYGTVNITLIGGGGGGGAGGYASGENDNVGSAGGGGAGELKILNNIGISPNVYTIIIGKGGNGGIYNTTASQNGDISQITGTNINIISDCGKRGSHGNGSYAGNGGAGYPNGSNGDSGNEDNSHGGAGGDNGNGHGNGGYYDGDHGDPAPNNSGGGGGGSAGRTNQGYPDHGGNGGSGYAKIEWTGWLL